MSPSVEVVGAPHRVLVAEDNELVRRLCRKVLEKAGYEVVEAADGREALDLFRHAPQSYDLALVDAKMPNMDGTALVRALRQIRPQLPCILSSGYGEVESLRPAEHADVYLLAKPYKTAALLRRVRSLCGAPPGGASTIGT